MDLTTAIARLLSAPDLREAYRRDRRPVAERLGVDLADWDAFLSLDPAGLEAQSEVLLSKRFGAVSRLLPQTFARLRGLGRALFQTHAADYWPQGHRRHLQDAAAFGRFLLVRGIGGLCRAEWNRVRLRASGRSWAVHGVRDLGTGDDRPGWGLQILYRRADGSVSQRAFYLALPAAGSSGPRARAALGKLRRRKTTGGAR